VDTIRSVPLGGHYAVFGTFSARAASVTRGTGRAEEAERFRGSISLSVQDMGAEAAGDVGVGVPGDLRHQVGVHVVGQQKADADRCILLSSWWTSPARHSRGDLKNRKKIVCRVHHRRRFVLEGGPAIVLEFVD